MLHSVQHVIKYRNTHAHTHIAFSMPGDVSIIVGAVAVSVVICYFIAIIVLYVNCTCNILCKCTTLYTYIVVYLCVCVLYCIWFCVTENKAAHFVCINNWFQNKKESERAQERNVHIQINITCYRQNLLLNSSTEICLKSFVGSKNYIAKAKQNKNVMEWSQNIIE